MKSTLNTGSLFELNWQNELEQTSRKYHLIVCWLAIILNPLWGIGDYFNVPGYWKIFLVIRVAVAVATLVGYLYRKKLGVAVLAFIPFLGIAIQNAYMYSVMEADAFQKHTFAYVALFIGAGMIVLWRPIYTILILLVTAIANLIFFRFFSPLTIDQIATNGGLLTATVALFTIILIQTRYSLTKKEIIARLALAESNHLLEQKKKIIEEKNKDITDSIQYAKGIQNAMLPSVEELTNNYPDSFIYFRPKDIVSGDFFWLGRTENGFYIAAADCTGHGVPGALMTMIGSSFLQELVYEKKISEPDIILNALRERVIQTLSKGNTGNAKTKDGMDISLLRIMSTDGNLNMQYAGAFNPIWLIRGGEVIEFTANKFPVGTFVNEVSTVFTRQEAQLKKGDVLILFTDGYADQFGGPQNKKFKYKQLKELLQANHHKSMQELDAVLTSSMKEWQGQEEQTDDMLVIGLRI